MTNFKINEYLQIRDEIVNREKAIGFLFNLALVSSITILSAIATFLFSKNTNCTPPKIETYILFFSPLAIITPIAHLIASHRKDIHRSGTYIQIFFETNNNEGPWWESRVSEFRNISTGESLDVIPWTFWVIYFICSVLFFYNAAPLNICSKFFILSIFILTCFAILLIIAHCTFSNFRIRDKYMHYWQIVKAREDKNSVVKK